MKEVSEEWQKVLLMALGSDTGRIPALRGVRIDDGHIVLITGPDAPSDLPRQIREHSWLRREQQSTEETTETMWYFQPNTDCCVSCDIVHALTKLYDMGVDAPDVNQPSPPELEQTMVRLVRVRDDEDLAAALSRAIAEDIEKLRAGASPGVNGSKYH